MLKATTSFASRCVLLVLLSATTVNAATKTESASPQPGIDGLREIQVSQKSFALGGKVPAWVTLHEIPETTQKEPAVTQLADTQFLVAEQSGIYVRRAIKVNEPAVLNQLGQIQLDFAPDYQKLTLTAIRIVRGQEILDRTHSVSIRFLQRETGLDQGIYSGGVTALVVVSDLRVGDTLDFEYVLEGQNPVFGNRFDQMAGWDQTIPTEFRHVSVTHPNSKKIAWKVLGGSAQGIATQRRVIGDKVLLSFEQRQLKSPNPVADAPNDFLQLRALQFSEYKEWAQVAQWAAELFPQPVVNNDLKEVVRRLAKEPDDERRVAAALEFVQSEIRYFSVLLGESSHRPTPPAEVLKRRYGDCKDKSYLLITLLRELGITARPVLVNLVAGRGIDQLLPSPTAFNHVIVQVLVNKRPYYLDPTRSGQYGKLDRQGQIHAGSKVLVVADGTQALSEIPLPEVEGYRSERIESAELAAFDGEAKISVKQVWRGTQAELIRVTLAQMTREQMNTAFSSSMESRYSGARLQGDITISDNRDENVLTSQATFSIPRFAEQDGNQWYVRYRPSNFAGIFNIPGGASRTVPLSIPGHPARELYVFEVQFPQIVSMQRDPEQRAVKNPYFDFSAASSFRGNRARLTLSLETLKDRVNPDELSTFQSEIRELNKLASGVVFVPKQAIADAAPVKKAAVTLAARLEEQVRQRVEMLDKTLASGKLSGEDLATTYCERGIAYSELGKHNDAIKDVSDAVRLAPNAHEILECQAEAYFNAGQFQKSIASYSRALALDGHASTLHYRRGIARYFQGQLAAAVDDFKKVLVSNDQAEALYATLWLSWSSQRAKLPLPDAVRHLASRKMAGEWPGPALAMLNGLASTTAVEEHLARFNGDEGQMMRSEGYFYLGQYFLTQGDRERARLYFEKCREQGILNYIEHTAAELELKRLASNVKAP